MADEWREWIEDTLYRLARMLDDDPHDWAVIAHDAIEEAWLKMADGTTVTVHLVNAEYYAERARPFEDVLRGIEEEW